MAQSVKNLPGMQETRVQSLGQEDPLEKEMAAHSSILAWGIPWTEEPSRLWSMGSQELDMTDSKTTTTSFQTVQQGVAVDSEAASGLKSSFIGSSLGVGEASAISMPVRMGEAGSTDQRGPQ